VHEVKSETLHLSPILSQLYAKEQSVVGVSCRWSLI
jgi:hypothetical protein